MACESLSIVVPAFNEAANLPLLVERVVAALEFTENFELIIVDDGSSDGSLVILRDLCSTYPSLRYIALSRNYGHQTALRAGLEHAKGEAVVCLDADLQHPPTLIETMVHKWRQGAEIVLCLRQDTVRQPLFKRLTSKWFYQLLSRMSGLDLQPGSSDFRLLDRKIVDVLSSMREADLFYRGILPTLGFAVTTIEYKPAERHHGQSKYTFRKMVMLALTGVINTSTKPLRLATYFAFATAAMGAAFLLYVLYIYFATDSGVPGWASTLGVSLVIGAMQLFVLGVIGEYLGQVLKEVRSRPTYLIAETGGLAADAPGPR